MGYRGASKKNIKKIFKDYFESIFIAVCIALFLRVFVISAYKIPTSSMDPTLKVGDFIFVNKMKYGVQWPLLSGQRLFWRTPQRGDVIVFRCPRENKSCVKRLIAFAGDRVEIQSGTLIVNGEPASYERSENSSIFKERLFGQEWWVSFTQDKSQLQFGPAIVPPGHYFVLGDSRDSSDDSRLWGGISKSSLEGQALFIWMSLEWSGSMMGAPQAHLRTERLFQVVR